MNAFNIYKSTVMFPKSKMMIYEYYSLTAAHESWNKIDSSYLVSD